MSRAKSKAQSADLCADCGAADPTWASVNRGILLCVECCCVHRNFGRHVSQVKSLQKSDWGGSLLTMVQTLNNSGVNNMWEHLLLLDGGGRLNKKKPNPRDPLDVKAEFIKEKHVNYSFVFRPNNEDGLKSVENELGQQLHASVRTNNLETSYRFLIQGADPNYFHDEKGTTPLHVAAKKNQILQVELLIVYGADPTRRDLHGKTPIDYAKQKGHKELANRLIELQYEVTDKFSYYLCQRKPEHHDDVHFLVPPNGPQSDQAIVERLRKLPNRLFEELVMDVFDEIDRREVEAIWLSSSDSVKLSALPFLPVDQTLSTTRNQSRQKLGKFSSPELKTLVYDILVDTQRRQNASDRVSLLSKGINLPRFREFDDDPLYDSVASDDDYAVVAESPEDENKPESDQKAQNPRNEISPCQRAANATANYRELTKKLEMSDTTISTLKQEVVELRALIDKLNTENTELKSRLSETNSVHSFFDGDSGCCSLDGYLDSKSNGVPNPENVRNVRMRAGRPLSMFETREGLKTPNWQNLKSQIKQNEQRTTNSLYTNNINNNNNNNNGGDHRNNINHHAQQQTLIQYTEQITKAIQQLMQCIQDASERDLCMIHSDKIKIAAIALTSHVKIEHSIETTQLLENVISLQRACASLLTATKAGNEQQVNSLFNTIREWAYMVAKETKQIVTNYNI